MGAPINRLDSIWSRRETRELPTEREQAVWGTRAKSWETSLEGILAKHPKAAIVAAAAVGIALGWIVKRK
jgi:hypothetical protein